MLFGPAYKGIPLSVAATIAISEKYGTDIRYCSNRKEVKDHGDKGILLGGPVGDNDKVIIIEDVTTAGTSIGETLPILQAQGNVNVLGIVPALRRALDYLNGEAGTGKTASDELLEKIGRATGGDVRRAIGLLENTFFAADGELSEQDMMSFSTSVGNFNDDTHFDLLSCLQKSIRGSDPDATAFYVGKLVAAGELLALCRRLQVIASEDIGLAYPQAAAITRACCESAIELGLPEGRIPLIHAAVLLATSPKSNSAYLALDAAMQDINDGKGVVVPAHLQSPLFKGYRYPHDYPDHYVAQEYLPDDLRGRQYYKPAPNKQELAAAAYWEGVRERAKKK